MPRDRYGDEKPPDDLFSGSHPAGCDHGMIEEHYDARGELLGFERWDPAISHVQMLGPTLDTADPCGFFVDLVAKSITYPCPRCRPNAHARWAAGCYRLDGKHNHSTCPYCIEDGRHAPKPPR